MSILIGIFGSIAVIIFLLKSERLKIGLDKERIKDMEKGVKNLIAWKKK